jgi:hypothetical protein
MRRTLAEEGIPGLETHKSQPPSNQRGKMPFPNSHFERKGTHCAVGVSPELRKGTGLVTDSWRAQSETRNRQKGRRGSEYWSVKGNGRDCIGRWT